MWCVFVCDQETSNEEAKGRYWAAENATKRDVTPKKKNNNKETGVQYGLVSVLDKYIYKVLVWKTVLM